MAANPLDLLDDAPSASPALPVSALATAPAPQRNPLDDMDDSPAGNPLDQMDSPSAADATASRMQDVTDQAQIPEVTVSAKREQPESFWSNAAKGVKDTGYAAAQGLGGAFNRLMGSLGTVTAAPAVIFDAAKGLATKQPSTAAQDWWFRTFVDPTEEVSSAFALNKDASFHEKAAAAAGNMLGTLSQLVLTGPEGTELSTGATGADAARAAVEHGMKAMAVPAVSDAVQTGKQVYQETGDSAAAVKAAQTQYLVTSASGILPLSAPGKFATRLLTGAASGVATGEIGRTAMNAALPDDMTPRERQIATAMGTPRQDMQQPFSMQDVALNALAGALMGGVSGPRARKPTVLAEHTATGEGATTAPEQPTAEQSAEKEAEPGQQPSSTEHAALLAMKDKSITPPQADLLEKQGLIKRNDLNEPVFLPAGRRRLAQLNEVREGDNTPEIVPLPTEGLKEGTPEHRLTTDQDLRDGLTAMKSETGWAQEGGRVIRDATTDEVTGRTSWIPNAEWWPDRPKGLTEPQVHAAVDKALAGEPLKLREQSMVDFMTQVHDERVAMNQAHAELREAVPDLDQQPKGALDLTLLIHRAGEHDTKATAQLLDSWNDDKPETLARVHSELQSIIAGGPEKLETPSRGTEEPAKAQGAPQGQEENASDEAIEQRFHAALQANPEAATRRYSLLPDSQGGRVLNVDTARELSPDYIKDRTRSAAVHEPASDFIKQRYAQLLKEPTKEGQDNSVLFTAGGTGSGKSSGLKVMGETAKRAQIIYDTNMNSLGSARKKVEQALSAGKKVQIAYVYRDPIDALRHGALPRAMRQEAKFGTGRTVPIEEHLKTHVGSLNTMRALAKEYADNPHVKIDAIDNTGKPGHAIPIPLESIKDLDYHSLREQAHETLETARLAGPTQGGISESVYRGFKGSQELYPESVRGGIREESQRSSQQRPTDLLKTERRVDTTQRKKVSEMSAEEAKKALLTHELTGIPNRRAYIESEKLPAQISIDVDSLKAINDIGGHHAGDELLKAVAKALSDETEHAYHLSGDEFAAQALHPREAHALMERVTDRLKNSEMLVRTSDGRLLSLKGLGVSYGVGEDLGKADAGLQSHKAQREAQGTRAPRGETPQGLTIGAAEAGRENRGGQVAPEEEVRPKSRRSGPSAGLPRSQVERAVHHTVRDANLAVDFPHVEVHQDTSTLPQHIQDIIAREGAETTTGAVYDPSNGRIHLIADNNGSDREVRENLWHEAVGHHGLRLAMDGPQYNAIMDGIARDIPERVEAAARRNGLDLSDPQQKRAAAEEVIAYAAGQHLSGQPIDKPVLPYWKRAVRAVKSFFARMTGKPFYDDKAIAGLIQQARQALERGAPGTVPGEPSRSTRAPTYYSPVERAVSGSKQEKASAEQWLATIKKAPGIKPDELEWLNLEPWLKDHKGPVTKAELSNYIRANKLEIQETLHGGSDEGGGQTEDERTQVRLAEELRALGHQVMFADDGDLERIGVRDVVVKNSSSQHAFDITDSMRQAALSEGFPMFSRRPSTARLFHGTNDEGEEGIRRSGVIRGPAYFSPRREVAEKYSGGKVLATHVPLDRLKVDLDMPGGRLLTVEDANGYLGKEGWTIEDYLRSGYSVGSEEDIPFQEKAPLFPRRQQELPLEEQRERDALAGVRRAVNAVSESVGVRDVRKLINPVGMSQESRQVAQIAREALGKLAHETVQTQEALEQFSRAIDKTPIVEQLAMMDAIEKGEPQPNPEMQPVADAMRKMLDDWRGKVQGLGSGYLDNFIENYFPHYWRRPDEAQRMVASIMGRRPLRGPASFLKMRTIPSIKEGMEAGLTPLTTNPLIMTLLKTREMQRFVTGVTLMRRFKEDGLAKFLSAGHQMPDGWGPINDNIAKVRSWSEEENGFIERGQYIMPIDAARVINNHVSASALRDFAPAQIFRRGANALNAMQLGFSAFHLGFTTLDAMISKNAQGTERLLHGEVGRAVASFAEGATPVGAALNIRRGYKLLHAYTNPAGATPEMQQLVRALEQGGGRAHMDRYYQAAEGVSPFRGVGLRSLAKDVRQALTAPQDKLENLGRALGSFPIEYSNKLWRGMQEIWKTTPAMEVPVEVAMRIVRASTSWIMEHLVPMQKLGVFSDLAADHLRRNPMQDPNERAVAMQRIWDSVDNRLGEMVYDNLFWNRTLKDSAHLGIRAVGWNVGTIREIGGAPVDVVKAVDKLVRTGKITADDLGHRIPYVLAMASTTALYAAIYQYLSTGQGPQELKDYFFPRTGGVTNYGTPQRVSLPSYVKDVYEYSQRPGQTIVNKLNPIFSLIGNLYSNQDFFGNPISDPEASYWQQKLQQLQFAGHEMTPFSLQGRQQMQATEQPSGFGATVKKALPMIGITPAPGYITSSEQIERRERLEADQKYTGELKYKIKKALMSGDKATATDLTKQYVESVKRMNQTRSLVGQDKAKAAAARRKTAISMRQAGYPATADLVASLPLEPDRQARDYFAQTIKENAA